jgi:hypothetical protein
VLLLPHHHSSHSEKREALLLLPSPCPGRWRGGPPWMSWGDLLDTFVFFPSFVLNKKTQKKQISNMFSAHLDHGRF